MLGFSSWIAGTRLSELVQDQLWLIPTVQTLHILALGVLFTSVGAVALRSFGRLGATVPVAQIARRFAGWVWVSLAVLAASGAILIVGEPVRELVNWAFWIKIPLILATATLTAAFLSSLARQPALAGPSAPRARRMALTLVAAWILVIVFGRLIAYAQLAA